MLPQDWLDIFFYLYSNCVCSAIYLATCSLVDLDECCLSEPVYGKNVICALTAVSEKRYKM